jgi:hypothetical protein
MNTPKVRSDCKYNPDELSHILPFKSDFINASASDRLGMMRRNILPAMFNYWQEIGKVLEREEQFYAKV